MKLLYFAHIPFVLLFALFAAMFAGLNWRGIRRP